MGSTRDLHRVFYGAGHGIRCCRTVVRRALCHSISAGEGLEDRRRTLGDMRRVIIVAVFRVPGTLSGHREKRLCHFPRCRHQNRSPGTGAEVLGDQRGSPHDAGRGARSSWPHHHVRGQPPPGQDRTSGGPHGARGPGVRRREHGALGWLTQDFGVEECFQIEDPRRCPSEGRPCTLPSWKPSPPASRWPARAVPSQRTPYGGRPWPRATSCTSTTSVTPSSPSGPTARATVTG